MGSLVPIVSTPWAPARDHAAIVLNLNAILLELGVEPEHVRRRLIAHAIVASGWRQACYNYNVWKSKRGGWSGDYYSHNTIEEKDGEPYTETGTEWRSYGSYGEAFADYRVWHLDRYREAKAVLLDGARSDREFAEALQAAGYWTAASGADVFAGVAARVAAELRRGGAAEAPFPSAAESAGAAAVGFGLWALIACGVAGALLVGLGVHLLNRGDA